MSAKKNKIPGRVKAFWCYGCKSFVMISITDNKYFCARLMQDINPKEHMDCRLRNIDDFTQDDDQMEIDFEGA